MVLIQSFVPGMRRAKFGRIVNISSRAILGKSERVVYASAKAGLEGMIRVVAIESGARNHGQCGHAGTGRDGVFQSRPPAWLGQRQTVVDKVSVKRLGTPQDVAHAVLFLLAPESGFITGNLCSSAAAPASPARGANNGAPADRIIGVGAWRKFWPRPREAPQIEFVCCVGRNPERLSAFSRDSGLPARDFDAVIADKTLPRSCSRRRTNCIRFFPPRGRRRQAHLYRKTDRQYHERALAIAALEGAHGVRIVIGHCARLLSGIRAIRAIDAGKLGESSQIEADLLQRPRLAADAAGLALYLKSSPSGSLSQIAIHRSTPCAISAAISRRSAPDSAGRHSPAGADVEDQWIVAGHFADGKLGSVVSSGTSPGTFNARATGANASMFYDIDLTHWAAAERLHENATLYLQARGKGPGDRQALGVAAGNMYRDELDMFAGSIASGAACELSAANGCQAVAAVYASLKSAKKEGSRVVPLNEIIAAVQAEFASDDVAKRRGAVGGR